jgi:MoxR-like ATPase
VGFVQCEHDERTGWRQSENAIWLGGGGQAQVEPKWLDLKLANRHGLIAGATGTGKTITMQVLAEEFSRAGVPVFLTDIKGDVAGMAIPTNTWWP